MIREDNISILNIDTLEEEEKRKENKEIYRFHFIKYKVVILYIYV